MPQELIGEGSMIKLIIFDFDGVIEDNYELNFQLSQKQFLGISREDHKKLFDGNVHEIISKLKDKDTGFDFRTHFIEAKKNLKTREEIKEVLFALAKEYTMGIISSAKESGINHALNANKINECFSFVWGMETDKNKVHKFERVLEENKLRKEDCIFITDTLGDIREAKKVGIRTIAVDYGYHERERLEKGNPEVIISDIKELIPVIRRIDNE